jgi:hypothetical protein
LRRTIINGVYWGLGMEDQAPEKSDVSYVDPFTLTPFGRNTFRKGLKPKDFSLQTGQLRPDSKSEENKPGKSKRHTRWRVSSLGIEL